ncbi:hypothetical protein [Saccharothrix obliqua]|uniref:hypothetical protein n=1 Tax=Saccharothrix obliqua TaxID=2861747 RepID=UPI001C5CFD24|nr:hypothetical protein [Saccharothrix obliqua]MBW4722307.1 hypothetical protein [Saccharothrix obliqua]
MMQFNMRAYAGFGRRCGCAPDSARLRTNGVVCVLVIVVWVVLQNMGVDPFAALGMVSAAGWVTAGLVPSLLGTAQPTAMLQAPSASRIRAMGFRAPLSRFPVPEASTNPARRSRVLPQPRRMGLRRAGRG